MNNPISLSVVHCEHVARSVFAVWLGLALLLAQSAAFATPPPCDGTENYTQVITVTSPANNTVFASGTTSATVTFTYSGYSSYLGATWALTSNGTTSQTGTVASTTQSFTISGLGAANYSLDITPKNGTLGAGCTVAKTDGIVAFSIAASAPPNAAQFISQSVPSSMVTGQVYPVSVTMKNTGTNTWTSATAYSLGSQNPISNSTWGANRFALPASVAPGATATISFNVTAPAPGSYNFQSQMVQDGVAWFGDYSTNVVVAVAKRNQAISFGALVNKLNSDAPFAVSATASSGLSISFSSLTTPVCTVSGTTITLVSVGSCSIAADQAGDATYNAAPQVVQSFTVAPPPPTVSLTTQSLAPIAPARIKFNAVGSAGVVKLEFIANNSVVFTETTASSYTYLWEGLGAGTYSLQVRATDGYNATVTSPVQTITIAAAPALPAGNTSETRSSIFDYDPVTGVLIKEVIEPNNPDLCLVTVYTQDNYGNVTTKTTRNCNGSGPTLPGAYAEGAAPAPGADSVFTARSASTLYDSRGQFPTTVTNALSQSETDAYDAKFGVRTSSTGPNGLTTTWAYDGYGRTVQENRADGTYSISVYPKPAGSSGAVSELSCTNYGQWSYNQTAICYQIYSISYSPTGAQIGQPVYIYLDQANRKLFTTRINFAGTDWIDEGLTYYDALGRVDKTFRSYQRGDWPAKNAVLAIKNYYDILGRVTEAHDYFTGSDTLVKSANYSGLISTSTVYTGNQSPQTTISTKNVAGQTALVEDPAGGRIRYVYDANGNPLGTDANGILNTVSYDLRGRKTGMVDADMGSWQYAYNALGELIRHVDALSQTTTMQYDILGRMYLRNEVGLISKWEFDTNRTECSSSAAANRAVGKVSAAFTLMPDGVTPISTRISCYDSLGRSSRELNTLTTGGSTFTSSITYDIAGRVDTATYPVGPSNPSGFAVRNVYNAQSYPSQLVRVSNNVVLWQSNGVDAFGHVTNETMGNGLVTQRTYDDRGRSMLVTTGTTQTVNTASALQYNGATYNNIDQVLQRNWVNAGTTISETYSYDDLNQITAVASSLGGLANKNYVYDYNGNFITKDGACTNGRGVVNCQYNYTPGTHKLASITGTVQGTSGIAGAYSVNNPAYQYDANGNLRAAADLTINWTGFNMPLSIIRGTVNGVNKTDTFTYGPEHQRLKQVATLANSSGTLTTLYLDSFEQETNSDTGAVDYKYYLSAGGRSLGVFVDRYTTAAPGGTPTDARYFHQDQLGSVVAVTDSYGGVIELLNYDAFGKRRNPDGSDSTNTLLPQNDRGYTGHEMLDTVGLIHMNGRIYDPTIGRFMSADPYIQAPGMTLSYNRYIYVMNNPFVLTDPSGYSWLSKTWKKAWHNPVIRTAIVIGVGIVTGGAAAAAYENYALGALVDEALGVGAGAITIGGSISVTSGVVAGAVGGFSSTLVATGGDFKAAAQSALTGAIFGGVGVKYDGGSFNNYVGHAVAGCAAAVLGGGNCGRGAAAQVFSKFVTVETRPLQLDFVSHGLVAAASGGAFSVATGGKFADGAKTAAMGYLYNEAGRALAGYAKLGLTYLLRTAGEWGYAMAASEVYFKPKVGDPIRIDGAAIKDGNVLFMEGKIGDYADLTKNQKPGFPQLEQGEGEFYGKDAAKLAEQLNIKPDAQGRFTIPAERIDGVLVKTYDRSTPDTNRMKILNDAVKLSPFAKGEDGG